jgi:hypothetical protein
MKSVVSLFILTVAVCSQTHAASLKQAYLDNTQNVHVVTSTGKDLQVTTTGHRTNIKLSSDGETAAWLVNQTQVAEGETEPAASELVIYRHGQTHSIKCEPFIRDYWFWKKDSRVAIDCGGNHFAGREILYDINSLKKLASFEQAIVPVEKRPTWSASSDQFDSN